MTTVDIKIYDEVKKIDFYIADKISPNKIGGINLLDKCPLNWKEAIVYFDDILIFPSNIP